jgi:hypothetical protein
MDAHSPKKHSNSDWTFNRETSACRVYGNEGAALQTFAKADMTINERKDCVIAAQANVFARMPFGATLAHNDVSGLHQLSAELLNSKTLAG